MAGKSKRRKGNSDGQSPRARGGTGFAKRKSCFFCKDHIDEVDYKKVDELRRYTSGSGKIRSRRMTGACRRHQRQIAIAVKRAREMALLPYVGPKDAAPARPRRS